MNDDDVFDRWLNQANEELIASISDSVDVDNVLATIKHRAATEPTGESADRAAELPGRILDRVRRLSIVRNRYGAKRIARAMGTVLSGIFQSKEFSAVLAAAAVTAVFVVLLAPLPGQGSPLLSFPVIAGGRTDIGAQGGTDDEEDGPARPGPGNDRTPDHGQAVPPVVQPTSDRIEPGEPAPGQSAPAEPGPKYRIPGAPMPEDPAPGAPAPGEPPEERVHAASVSASPAVQNERIVELSTPNGPHSVEIDSWQQVNEESDDLYIDQDGIVADLGATLSVIDGSQEPTYYDCAQRPTWVPRVDFAGLQEGSRICAHSRTGRYAVLTVMALPAPGAADGKFVFRGKTWQLPRQAPPDQPPPGQAPGQAPGQPTPRQSPPPEPAAAQPPPPPPGTGSRG